MLSGLRHSSSTKPSLPDGVRIYAISDIHGCALKGNHEAFLGEVFRDLARIADWLQVGGMQTLMSYGLAPSVSPPDDEQRELVRELAAAMPPLH